MDSIKKEKVKQAMKNLSILIICDEAQEDFDIVQGFVDDYI